MLQLPAKPRLSMNRSCPPGLRNAVATTPAERLAPHTTIAIVEHSQGNASPSLVTHIPLRHSPLRKLRYEEFNPQFGVDRNFHYAIPAKCRQTGWHCRQIVPRTYRHPRHAILRPACFAKVCQQEAVARRLLRQGNQR